MTEGHWDRYPLVRQNATAQGLLRIQENLQLAPKTIDAYGHSLNDFQACCQNQNVVSEQVTREHIALYVNIHGPRADPGILSPRK